MSVSLKLHGVSRISVDVVIVTEASALWLWLLSSGVWCNGNGPDSPAVEIK